MERKGFKFRLVFFVLLSFFKLIGGVSAQDKSPQIRNIRVVVRDVFDKGEDALFYRTANVLKINTKEDIVRRELLFKEGDDYNKFTIAESGRNLRSLPFLRNISIIENRDGGFVDIVVSVQDTWTLFPVISVSSGSGTSNRSIGVIEGNLGGYGKRFEALLEDDEGRRKYETVWDDRRFLGTLQRFSLGHFERSDGRSSVLSWGKPFRSLLNNEAYFVDVDNSDLIGRLFQGSSERFIYRQKHTSFMGGYTLANGDPSQLLSRFTYGYSYRSDRFSEADDSDYESIALDRNSLPINGGRLAEDRRFSGPVVSWQLIKPEFISLNYIDNFDRVQDFNLGNELVVNLHASPAVLGSYNDSVQLGITDTNGLKITPQQFLRGQVSLSSRLEGQTLRESIVSAQGRYYRVYGPQYVNQIYLGQHTLASSIVMDSGFNLYEDREFVLGASNGLRGYKDRAFTGFHKVNLNLEDRVHLVDEIGKLVNLGVAAFVDTGSVSNNNFEDVYKNGLYTNVGVGFRFGLTRSSGGTVVRVDLAVPLRDGPDGTSKYEPRLLFTTGQLFSASLRSDAPGLSTPSTSAGFTK